MYFLMFYACKTCKTRTLYTYVVTLYLYCVLSYRVSIKISRLFKKKLYTIEYKRLDALFKN